jgi:hypothetical protein
MLVIQTRHNNILLSQMLAKDWLEFKNCFVKWSFWLRIKNIGLLVVDFDDVKF